jgi:hypothetical protein
MIERLAVSDAIRGFHFPLTIIRYSLFIIKVLPLQAVCLYPVFPQVADLRL